MPTKRRLSYAQLITLFVLLGVIPLYLFFMLVYRDAYGTIREDLLTSISLEGGKIMADIDAELSGLQLRQQECLSLLCTRRITLEDSQIYTNYEIISAKQELAEMVTVVLLSSKILDAFDIYFPRTGSRYRSASGWGAMDPQERAYLDTLLRAREGRLMPYGDTHVLYQTNRRAYAPAGSPADVVMVARVSDAKLVSMFAARLPNSLRNLFLLATDSGQVIASTKPDMAAEVAALAREQGDTDPARAVPLLGAPHFVIAAPSQVDDITLHYVVAQEAVTAPLQRFATYFVLSLALLITVLALLAAQSYYFMYQPVYKLLRGFGHIQRGDLTVRLDHGRTREFDLLNLRFNEMADSLDQLIQQRYALRLLAREAELKQLYAQINPHFLYNCFFTVQTMLEEENYDCCSRLAHLLGVYLQYLSVNPQSTAKLAEEVRHAEAYACIQSMRFGARVDYQADALPEAWAETSIPRLVLQPLLENAFEHGIGPRKERSVIAMRFHLINADAPEDRRLTVVIENQGAGLTDAELERIRFHAICEPVDTQGVALYNIHKRLQLTSPDQQGLCFSQSELGGLRVSLTLRWGVGPA